MAIQLEMLHECWGEIDGAKCGMGSRIIIHCSARSQYDQEDANMACKARHGLAFPSWAEIELLTSQSVDNALRYAYQTRKSGRNWVLEEERMS